MQTAIDTISETVNEIIEGVEALPYLPDTYTPPIASSTQAGIVKQGNGITISQDGTISTNIPVPTAEDEGKLLVVENGAYVLKTLTEIQGGV